jgi:peptide/nickel transport system permease protein
VTGTGSAHICRHSTAHAISLRVGWDGDSAGRLQAAAGQLVRRQPLLAIGLVLFNVLMLMALLAPLSRHQPAEIDPLARLLTPSLEHWLGTDHLGRDVFARTLHGARVSLTVGLAVAAVSTVIGLAIGLLAGFVRWVEIIVMRLMEGLMAIPAVLLAIALVALTRPGLGIVIAAIVIPEVPRVVRLVRSIVLSVREQPFVEAAIASGTPLPTLLVRHILPATLPALTVQATSIAGAAILIEAALSFLGAGTPPEIPTWGNMIAQSRLYLSLAPWTIFAPGLALAAAVLALNLIGDGLRDRLDPRLRRRL